jgi:ATP-dependent helicase/nuclease subunit B
MKSRIRRVDVNTGGGIVCHPERKMNGRAIIAQSFEALEGAIRSEIARIREGDLFTRIDVLVGSNLLGVHLKRRLAEDLGGLFNVHFLTFIDLVSLLEARSADRVNRRLPPLAERVIVSDIVSSDVPAAFAETAPMRGFTAPLLEVFDDLAESGCTAELVRRITEDRNAARHLNDRVIGVLHLYVRYRERLSEHGDDIHARFARVLARIDEDILDGPLLVYGFYDFNEMQWRLIEAIASGPGITLFVPWCNEAPYRFAGRTIERIERNGFSIERVAPGGRETRRTPEKLVIDAPGEEEEVRMIVRRILSLAGERGIRFGDIGILLPTVDPYRALFTEALEEAGIPYFAGERPDTDVRVLSRSAQRLLALLGGRMGRRALAEFLVSAPLGSPSTNGFDPLSLWVRVSAEAGIIGPEGWVAENRRLVEMLESKEECDEETQRAVAAARLMDTILQTISYAREVFSRTANWRELTRVFSSLIRDLFEPSGNLEHLCTIIEDLEALDAVSGAVSHETFSSIVESALEAGYGSHGRLGGAGVNLLTIGQARGVSFRVVFVPGLIERVLPGVVRQDPFLRDDERRSLARLSGGRVILPARMARLEEEALLFRLAVDAAVEMLVCSSPRYESGTGKQLIPSSYIRSVGALPQDFIHEKSLASRWSASGEGETPPHTPMSGIEYDLMQVFAVKRGAGSIVPNTFLARGIALVKARWGTRRFTHFDGVFSSRESLHELRKLLDERGWSFSPTSMEKYAHCPFAYFLEDVIGLELLEEPERLISISPLQRGTIVHEILARLYDAFRRKGLLPLDASRGEEAAALAGLIANRFLDEYPKREPVGLPVFWEMERHTITIAIRRLIEEECGAESGLRPVFFEKSFGAKGGKGDISFECGKRTIYFHGRIDRIDLGEGDRFRVIDYKTGRLDRLKDQELGGGTTLQLPIYLWAASHLLDRPVSAGIAQYWRVGLGGGKRHVSYAGEAWDKQGEELAVILDTIARGVEQGYFFAVPSSDRCAYCAVQSACPSGAGRIFARKAVGDERCRDYLAMRGLTV